MRNPFKNIGFKSKKKPELDQKPIQEPWRRRPGETPTQNSGKTIMGKRPDKDPIDEGQSSAGSGYQCTECSYPLRIQASLTSPCPNCGFTGHEKEVAVVSPVSAKKTINFGSLNFGQLTGERKFSLINESSPEMSVNADLGESEEITLGREELDPSNPSISGNGHIKLRESQGKWYIHDISSNGATFLQATQPQFIADGVRVILGNRIFRFSTGAPVPPPKTGNKTMQFGQFNLAAGQSGNIFLIDELTGLTKNFNGAKIDINRFNIDPDEQSISSKEHATLENRQGTWMIVDRSSNQATFVQVIGELQITDQTNLILGNKVFRFKLG